MSEIDNSVPKREMSVYENPQYRGILAHRFKKGASGNPKGRPKKHITDIYNKILRDKEKRERIQAAVESMVLLAGKETPRMLREMADRTEGKPIGAAEDGPREIQISIANLGGTTQIVVGMNGDK